MAFGSDRSRFTDIEFTGKRFVKFSKNGWMTGNFTSFSSVFHSYQDNVYHGKDLCPLD